MTLALPKSGSIAYVLGHTFVQLWHPMQVSSSTNTCITGQVSVQCCAVCTVHSRMRLAYRLPDLAQMMCL